MKVIALISAVLARFETVSKYRNNRNKPKEVIIFFRKKYRNRTETAKYFGLFRFETKEKKSVSQETLALITEGEIPSVSIVRGSLR